MTLSEKQQRFASMIGKLLLWVDAQHGMGVTFGETFRPAELASLYAEQGRGIKNSNHTRRLAVDLNLFLAGKYQTSSESYRPLGEYWESIGGAWGGRFSKPDGNHFSVEHGGIR